MLILKFKLPRGFPASPTILDLPAEAIFLSVGQKYALGDINIWFSTDAQNSQIVRRVFVYLQTGQSYNNQYPMQFLGTVVSGNCEVFHVFEVMQESVEILATPTDRQLAEVLEVLEIEGTDNGLS